MKRHHCACMSAERGFPTTDGVHGQWTGEKQQQQQSVIPRADAAAVSEPRKMGPGQKAIAGIPTKGTTIHTLVTSNGSPYLNFQNRIMCGPNARSTPPKLAHVFSGLLVVVMKEGRKE